MRLRVGLAGYGYWGPNLARALNSLNGAEFCAVAEKSEHRLHIAKALYSDLITFQSVEELITSKEVDAIVIAMPAKTHESVAKLALEAGLHVLVEKPMVFSAKVGIELENIAKKNGLVLMPGHTFVYNDSIVWAKNYIKEGKLGKILNIYSQRLNLGQLRHDINVVWNLAPHDVSLFDFLLGERVKSVSATGSSISREGIEDLAFIALTYESGIIAHSHVSWLDPTKTRKVTVIGTSGMLIIDDTRSERRIEIHEKYIEKVEEVAPTYNNFNASLHSGNVSSPMFNFREPLLVELQDFVDSILQNQLPRANSTDGVWVAKVLQAVDKSIRQNGSSFEVR
jgi:predicted dehydrogenase